MEFQELHVGPEHVEAKHRERLRALRETLPHQRDAMEDAALQFGLPMTGQEIHDRVRRVLPARVGLPLPARIGVGIFAVGTTIFLGVLLPWALSYWQPCKSNCGDTGLGVFASFFLGLVCFGIGGAILGGNIQRRTRTSAWTDVGYYSATIPEAALLKLAAAMDSGLFKNFYVVEPTYEVHVPRHWRTDPWLIGSVVEHPVRDNEPREDGRRGYIVLAYWE